MLARKAIISWLVVLVCCAALSGCARPPAQPVAEQPPPTEAPSKMEPVSSTPQPKEMPEPPPPKPDEVQQAVKHVFKDAVIIDVSRDPSFLVGDFNGDLSQDLAVVLKPAEGKLSELNQEFPNWIAREPLEEAIPKSKLVRSDPAKASPNPAAGQTVRFEQRDVLLAIIHGYGPNGWRDPEATQTHLLRDVVGTNMRTLPYKGAVKTFNGIRPFPSIYGDLIQQTLVGQSGFLHYTGGMYGWYDPKNYKLVAATSQGHSMVATMGPSSKPKRSTPGTRH